MNSRTSRFLMTQLSLMLFTSNIRNYIVLTIWTLDIILLCEVIKMDQHKLNVANAPKTSTFQMRINPEIKQQVENIYSRQGLTFTDAVNGGRQFFVMGYFASSPNHRT